MWGDETGYGGTGEGGMRGEEEAGGGIGKGKRGEESEATGIPRSPY